MAHSRLVPAFSSRIASAAVAAGTILWLGLLIISPYLVSRTPPRGGLFRLGGTVYLACRVVCHQRADRSFHLAGVQLPVCGRCIGLYAGAAVGALLSAFQRRSSRRGSRPDRKAFREDPGRSAAQPDWLLRFCLAGAPTVASLALELAGVWPQSPAIRCGAALPLGFAAGWFVAAYMPDVIRQYAVLDAGLPRR